MNEDLNAYLRPSVREFALAMEDALRAHDHKPGWKSDPAVELFLRLEEEVNELREELVYERYSTAMQEAADVANFAMMIFDVLRVGVASGDMENK